MGIIELMQRALDKTNDPDAIFALDRGITEIERLRNALQKIGEGNVCVSLLTHPSQCGRAYQARSALTEKP
jgi:hypothetical protein